MENSQWINSGFMVDSRWINGGFTVASQWTHGGFMVDSRWIHGGLMVDSRWIHDGLNEFRREFLSTWCEVVSRQLVAWPESLEGEHSAAVEPCPLTGHPQLE